MLGLGLGLQRIYTTAKAAVVSAFKWGTFTGKNWGSPSSKNWG
jgi:hypothetical protein